MSLTPAKSFPAGSHTFHWFSNWTKVAAAPSRWWCNIHPQPQSIITSILATITLLKNNSLSSAGQWKLHGLNCYQFFSIRHSWQKASELCKRYGSNLVSVASFRQNNFTGELAQQQLQTSNPEDAYWLGYQTQNELQTNTLASASGSQISQYYGHWAQEQPDTGDGRCVEALLPEDPRRQQWALTRCETLLPFMCEIQVSLSKVKLPPKTSHTSYVT